MSRLDSFIRRLSAQRDILDHVAEALPAELTGPIFELGLGNGRTYDHLREKFPNHRIIAFDRVDRSFGPSAPAPENLVTGEIKDKAQAFIGMEGALVHADIGTGHDDLDAVTLNWLPQLALALLAPGGFAVSGLPLEIAGLEPLPLPATVREGRYFLYRSIG